MEQTVIAKVQLYPDADAAILLTRTMDAYREACDFVFGSIFHSHELNYFRVNNALYADTREKFGLKAQMTQSVIKTAIAKYRTEKSNRHAWTRCVFKKPQYDLIMEQGLLSLKGQVFC